MVYDKTGRPSRVKGCWHTLMAVMSAWISFKDILENTIPSSFTSPANFILVAAVARNNYFNLMFLLLDVLGNGMSQLCTIRGKFETIEILWTYCSSRSTPYLKYIHHRIRQDLRSRGHRDDECLEVTVLKKKLGKTFKYLYRRIFLGFWFEFTISIWKSSFSSLAYDPALSVPAQKCKTGFSQFAYLEKKQVFQLVVFRLARKTV